MQMHHISSLNNVLFVGTLSLTRLSPETIISSICYNYTVCWWLQHRCCISGAVSLEHQQQHSSQEQTRLVDIWYTQSINFPRLHFALMPYKPSCTWDQQEKKNKKQADQGSELQNCLKKISILSVESESWALRKFSTSETNSV